MGVGEALVESLQAAIKEKRPYILFVASGGARMQEGILSLMQMPRATICVDMLREAGLPYIVVLTDPTFGGVSASYAMLGDIQIAEPGAQIGFTGARVIAQTIREKLPEGFQRAEYLLEHGMLDMVTHRKELRATLSRVLHILMKQAKPAQPRCCPCPSATATAAPRSRRADDRRDDPQRRGAEAPAGAASQEDRSGAGPHPAAAARAGRSAAAAAAGHPCRGHQRQGLACAFAARHAGSAGPARACPYLAASGALP